MDLTVFILMVTIGLCVFMQPSKERLVVAAVFVVALLGHDLVFHTISDNLFWYYLSAGILDFGIIIFISNMPTVPRMGADIQLISIISLMINFGGFLIANGGHEAWLYNAAFVVIYSCAIFALLRGGPENDRNYAMDGWISAFRFNDHPRHTFNHHHKEAQ